MDPEPSYLHEQVIDVNLIIYIVGIIIFLFHSALISGAKVAFFTISSKELENSNYQNNSRNSIISKLLEAPKKLSATLLICHIILNIGIILLFSLVSDIVFHNQSSPLLLFVQIVIIVFVLLFFVEILPKRLARRNHILYAQKVAPFIKIVSFVLTPFSLPMRNLLINFQDKFGFEKNNFSVSQLSRALEMTSDEDTSQEEQKILEGIVSFGSTDTSQVMTPRIDVFALEITETFTEIYPKIVDKGYSRIPVYSETIDKIEGVLFVKDLIPFIHKKDFEWQKILRQPFYIPENKKLDDLLKDFQTMKSHLAIVVDEYGGTSGIITLEDIIEEIVGDISDEFDDENISYSQIDDKNYIFEGKISLKDFYRIIDVDEELFEEQKGEAETLAGFILEYLGNFPKTGQKITFSTLVFTIEHVDKRRIKQIKVTLES